jgi:hypothetical protein
MIPRVMIKIELELGVFKFWASPREDGLGEDV